MSRESQAGPTPDLSLEDCINSPLFPNNFNKILASRHSGSSDERPNFVQRYLNQNCNNLADVKFYTEIPRGATFFPVDHFGRPEESLVIFKQPDDPSSFFGGFNALEFFGQLLDEIDSMAPEESPKYAWILATMGFYDNVSFPSCVDRDLVQELTRMQKLILRRPNQELTEKFLNKWREFIKSLAEEGYIMAGQGPLEATNPAFTIQSYFVNPSLASFLRQKGLQPGLDGLPDGIKLLLTNPQSIQSIHALKRAVTEAQERQRQGEREPEQPSEQIQDLRQQQRSAIAGAIVEAQGPEAPTHSAIGASVEVGDSIISASLDLGRFNGLFLDGEGNVNDNRGQQFEFVVRNPDGPSAPESFNNFGRIVVIGLNNYDEGSDLYLNSAEEEVNGLMGDCEDNHPVVLRPKTKEDLLQCSNEIRKANTLIVIGHGEKTANGGNLKINEKEDISYDEFGNFLANAKQGAGPLFLIPNTCHSNGLVQKAIEKGAAFAGIGSNRATIDAEAAAFSRALIQLTRSKAFGLDFNLDALAALTLLSNANIKAGMGHDPTLGSVMFRPGAAAPDQNLMIRRAGSPIKATSPFDLHGPVDPQKLQLAILKMEKFRTANMDSGLNTIRIDLDGNLYTTKNPNTKKAKFDFFGRRE